MQKSGVIGDIDRYEILQPLGSGAYSIVYKAKSLITGEIVAIKKMKKLTKANAEMVKKEIQIMEGLNSKYIVQYITNFRYKGDWYIVLEYCGRGDLEQYKKKVGKIPEYHCKLFVKSILQAIKFMHEKNIAHRDLKLSNILITENYDLKLADFGFSKDYEAGYFISFCGTPLSMAPEILKRQKYSLKCDVWSLGVLTFMMLFGRPPYFPTKSDGSDFQGLVNAVTKRKHTFDANVKVSPNGIDFINKCLQKSADNRPSAKQLQQHQWFKQNLVSGRSSIDRRLAMEEALKDDYKKVDTLLKLMFFGVFERNMNKIAVAAQLGEDKIKEMVTVMQKHYLGSDIREAYLHLALDTLQKIAEMKTAYQIEDSKFYSVPFRSIKKFNQFYTKTKALLNKELQALIGKNGNGSNNQQLICNFILQEVQQLMEANNEVDITEKLRFLKSLGSMMRNGSYDSRIVVRWGRNSEYEEVSGYVVEIIQRLREEDVIAAINEEVSDEDDIENVWLIEYQLQGKDRKSECGGQIDAGLEVLEIASNFAVDKTMLTDKIDLSEHLMTYS